MDLLILPSSEIVMDPSESIFLFVIKTIETMWEENLYAIKPLLSDPFFHSFTRYKGKIVSIKAIFVKSISRNCEILHVACLFEAYDQS